MTASLPGQPRTADRLISSSVGSRGEETMMEFPTIGAGLALFALAGWLALAQVRL